jgi:hypothetical protein
MESKGCRAWHGPGYWFDCRATVYVAHDGHGCSEVDNHGLFEEKFARHRAYLANRLFGQRQLDHCVCACRPVRVLTGFDDALHSSSDRIKWSMSTGFCAVISDEQTAVLGYLRLACQE